MAGDSLVSFVLDLNAKPNNLIRQKINELYEQGNYIIFQTARGKSSGKDWTDLTKSQLKNWGFKYKPPNIPRYPSSNSCELLPKLI